MDLAEGVEIEVVESTLEKVYLVIPPKPEPVGELSDEDLEKVAGGIFKTPPPEDSNAQFSTRQPRGAPLMPAPSPVGKTSEEQ